MTMPPPLASLHDSLSPVLDALTGDNIWEMTLRAVFIYVFALVLVRVGKSRMLSEATVFDIILMFILGSTLSRIINGSAPLLPSLAASAILVAAHFVLGISAFHTRFGNAVKGQPNLLIEDGKIVDDALHEHHLTENDVKEALHQNGLTKIEDVKIARLERNGKISVVPKTRIIEIGVKEGVQTVRIEM